MTERTVLKAEPREGAGTGRARAVRRSGQVPAIVYGGKGTPAPVSLNEREVLKQIATGHFTSTIYFLEIGTERQRVIPRAVQVHPVTEMPVHVDFVRLEEGATIALPIPVHFKNQDRSPGIKRGGVLNVVRHTVDLVCPADRIPEFIEGDLEGLDINDSLHISAFKLPEGVHPAIRNRDFTVATIAAPSGLQSEVAAASAEAAAAPAAGAAPAAAPGAAPAAGAKAGDAKAAAPAKGGDAKKK